VDKNTTLHATVAVTGLNANDNPGPGVGVIRSLRADPCFDGRIVGLTYNHLDPGIYDSTLADDVYLLPYPSNGRASLLEHLRRIVGEAGIDVIIPTLDAELPAFIDSEEELSAAGAKMFVASRKNLHLREKTRLTDLGKMCGIPSPKTHRITAHRELPEILDSLSSPIVVKGIFYEATICRNLEEAVEAFNTIAARWGLPVVVQEYIEGEEYDVAAVGDGAGGLLGAVPMKKLSLTEKGKAWAGVTVGDSELIDTAKRLMQSLSWAGPCEVELIREKATGILHLLEINPRFPAWIYLATGAGQNLPSVVVRKALGQEPTPLTSYSVGTMFVRMASDMIAELSDFEKITTGGHVARGDIRP